MSPLQEIETVLKKTAKPDPDYKAFREKTTKLTVLGHRLPILQALVKKGFSFYEKSPAEILKIWDELWQTTRIHEAMILPLLYYRVHLDLLHKKEWVMLKTWVKRIENWEHSDGLSALYSVLYERYPALVEPTLRKWNGSKNPWEQRASIVSLIYYATPRRKAPPIKTVLELVKPLIPSRDKYVAKAVGWTLREAYTLYPKETLAFLTTHIKELAPDSFSYGIEKCSPNEKASLKKLRARS